MISTGPMSGKQARFNVQLMGHFGDSLSNQSYALEMLTTPTTIECTVSLNPGHAICPYFPAKLFI